MPYKIIPTIPFTAEEYAKNKAELARLTALRVEVMERLKVAREMGDLSENGAYKYAKFELGDIGRRSRQLKYLVENGYVAETDAQTTTVDFGKTVKLSSNGAEFNFLIVNEFESDMTTNKLSYKSPLGQALMGKKKGEAVKVPTPKGEVEYLITNIK